MSPMRPRAHPLPPRATPLRGPIACGVILALSLWAGAAGAGPLGAQGEPARTGEQAGPGDAAYRQAIDAMVRQDWAAADRAFRESLRLQPQAVPARLGLAELAFRTGDLAQAGRHIDEALRLDPERSEVLAAKGRHLALQGKLTEAANTLSKAAERDPRAIRPRMDLADMLVSRSEHRQAIDLYRQVLAIDGRHAGARFALGVALRETGDRDAAVRELRAAIGLAPEAARAHVELARTEFQRRRFTEALSAADAAVAVKPTPVEAWLVHADALEATGRVDDALRSLASAAQAAPRAAAPHLRTGMIEHQRGRLDAAEQAYRRALDLDRRQPVALNNLAAIALARKTGLAEAEGWAREATRLNPRAAHLQHTLGEVLRAQGKTADALAAYEAAASLLPGDARLAFHHGRALAEAGQKDRAREVVRAALEKDPNFTDAADARRLLATL